MPSADKRRKRALAADGSEHARVQRELLSASKVSRQTLQTVMSLLRDHPEVADSSIGAIDAGAASFFETVRHTEELPMQDRCTSQLSRLRCPKHFAFRLNFNTIRNPA